METKERERRQNIARLQLAMKVLFVHLSIFTGARRGEIAGLDRSDIDLNSHIIRFRGTTYGVSGNKVEFKDSLKNGDEYKVVPFPTAINKVILDYYKLLDTVRKQNKDWINNDHLFICTEGGKHSKPGEYANPDIFSDWFRKLLDNNAEEIGFDNEKIKSVHLHTLRHSFCTHHLNEGLDIITISKLAGHSSTQVTSKIYAHSDIQKRQKAADSFGAIYSKVVEGPIEEVLMSGPSSSQVGA